MLNWLFYYLDLFHNHNESMVKYGSSTEPFWVNLLIWKMDSESRNPTDVTHNKREIILLIVKYMKMHKRSMSLKYVLK